MPITRLRQTCSLLLPLLLASIVSARADVVTEWNTAALNAIRTASTNPPVASRNLAILHTSIYDAVNGIRRTHQTYFIAGPVPSTASVEAAVANAARRVLASAYPAQKANFDALRAQQLALIPDGPDKAAGLRWGRDVAKAILVWRATDGSAQVVAYTPGTAAGEWRPTPPAFANPLVAHWGSIEPFAMIAGSQFRKRNGPPAVTSQEYTAEYNETKEFGSATSAIRTAEQTQTAHFWSNGGGTSTPPGHWNQIAQVIGLKKTNTVEENARLFALLNIALADAAIVSWDSKYAFNFWRPITAIREGDADGNPDTVGDATWTPLLTTPPFPEYTSGHSTFSAAAAEVIAGFYHSDTILFTIGSDGLPNVTRTYRSLMQAARESAISRVFGGIHFQSGNQDGLLSGAELGRFVSEEFLLPRNRWDRSGTTP